MIFQHFLLNSNESNLYVVACERTKEAVLIDAGAYDTRVTEFVEKQDLKVTQILITHGHWDHNGGVGDYKEYFGCPEMGMAQLADGQKIDCGDLNIHVLHTPGHTYDSISLYIASEGVLFSGDALFAGSIGGTSSDGLKSQLLKTLRDKVLSLPPETVIYSGHGPATSVGVETKFNPFLKQ